MLLHRTTLSMFFFSLKCINLLRERQCVLHKCHGMYVEVRGQLAELGPSYYVGPWGLN